MWVTQMLPEDVAPLVCFLSPGLRAVISCLCFFEFIETLRWESYCPFMRDKKKPGQPIKRHGVR